MHRPFAVALTLATGLAAASFAQSQSQLPRAPQAPTLPMMTPEQQATVQSQGQQQSAPQQGGQIVGFVEASLSGTSTLGEAGLPEVQVSIPAINGQPGQGRTVETNSVGRFRTPILAPGSYSICAARDGFTTSCVKAEVTDHNVGLDQPTEIKPVGSALRGCVTLKGGSPAARNAPALQDTAGWAEVSALNATGQVVAGPVKVNAAGCYVLPRVPDLQDLRIQAKYEQASVQQPVAAGALASGAPVNVTFPNAPPSISAFSATLNGHEVTRVPPGSTVTASVEATSPENYPLHYTWADGTGTALPGDRGSQEWRLPGTNSLNLLFVEVSDGHGGVARDVLAISTGAAPPQAPTQSAPPPDGTRRLPIRIPHPLPEKKFQHPNQTFIDPAGFMSCSDAQSCTNEATLYYESLGVFDNKGNPNGTYSTFGQWKKYWAFSDDPTKPDPSGLGVRAVYYNNADLQFGRDMHCQAFGFFGDETTPWSAHEIDYYPAVCLRVRDLLRISVHAARWKVCILLVS